MFLEAIKSPPLLKSKDLIGIAVYPINFPPTNECSTVEVQGDDPGVSRTRK